MAPRKKRAKGKAKTNRNTRSTVKKQLAKPEELVVAADNDEDVLEKQDIRTPARTASTHKKFGKFRCLLETNSNCEAGLETEEEQLLGTSTVENNDCQENDSSTAMELQDEEKINIDLKECTDIDTAGIQEVEEESGEIEEPTFPVDLQEAGILRENDNTVVELASEILLQPSAMEYTDVEEQTVEGLATEVVDQFSNLNFNLDSNPAAGESMAVEDKLASTNQIFNVDTIQSDITVECVSEEIIAVLGEQEIEIGDTSDIETPVEGNTIAGDALEHPTAINTIEEQAECEIAVPTAKPSKPKNVRNAQKPKTNARKKPVPITKGKKEPKNTCKNKKPLEKMNSDTSEGSTTSENSVRRSSRIKSISVLKLRSKGQGLVKQKTDVEIKKTIKGSSNVNDSDTSENSNSGHTDSEKASTDSPNFLTPSSGYDSDHKPVKVKSRWRRSSELEMGNCVVQNSSRNADGVHSELPAAPLNDEKIENGSAHDEEIRSRLKQFIHLKENHYLTSRVSCKEAKKMICDCFLTTEEIDRGELACGEDCLNRLLMIECGQFCPINERCTNKRFQKSQFSPCEVFRTDKKGLGIRATADIPFGEFILEYIGEVIGPDEFEERATEYSKGKNPHYYFMSLRSDAVIDATQKGNISRFINHSCEPNAETQKWTVNGELRIGFFSKRTILAGEEITFDYQFQRYGKEAQRCFCEAPTCRGWLGEEPDEDEEEEEEDYEEEEEEEEAEADEEVVQPDIEQPPTEIVEEIIKIQPPVEAEVPLETIDTTALITTTTTPAITTVTTPVEVEIKKLVKKEKRKVIKRKVLKDIFDDVDVDEEIEMLIATGLKNQAHTLKLSRLMVRANEASQRTALLRILRHGEFPCRRLFLDYHGLRLIHGWMNDAQQMCKADKKQESLRLELLQTLATLPIPNKTMLQDSKVLSTVETWSTKLEDVSAGLDSESNSPKLEIDSVVATEIDSTETKLQRDSSVVKIEKENDLEISSNKSTDEHIEETYNKENEANTSVTDIEKLTDEDDIEEIRRSVGMDIEQIRCKNQSFVEPSNKKTVQDIIDMFDDDMDISPIAFNEDDNIIEVKEAIKSADVPKQDYEVEIIALALKLLEEWSILKEVFRIPKKERIEQMKEHEREANRGYKAGLEHDSERKSRYRGLSRHRSSDKIDFSERVRKGLKLDERSSNPFPKINKHERRKLFAMQVEQEEVEKRLKQRDMWRQHEFPYIAVGADPRFTAPFDPSRNYQCIWNQQTGQWQNYPIAINHNPLLNPNMTPRFNSAVHYPYNTGNNVPPMPNIPPPLPNMPLPASTMPLTTPSMSHPPPSIPHSIPNMSNISLPAPNYSHPVTNMPHPASNVSHPAMNMSHPPLSMPNPPTNLSHPLPTVSHPPPNFTHQVPTMPQPTLSMPPPNLNHPPPNMPHPPPNMPHPPPNMPHPPPNMPHPPPNMPHPPPNMPHPPPNMPHPSQNLSIPNIPTNIPPPLPNVPPLPSVPQLTSNSMLSSVPPLPSNLVNNISSLTGNPVSSMPPLPNIPPPLPHMPPAIGKMQQLNNMPYQEEKANEQEDLSQVKFAGPIPPPAKLPPKWKCAKDKYGRPYYYHIKLRVSQWEPPELPPPIEAEEESSDSTSSSDTSSLSSDSSSEDSDDDDPDDTKLLLEIRRKFQQMESVPKSSPNASLEQESKEDSPEDSNILKNQEQLDETVNENQDCSKSSSLDERLKEEFNLAKRESQNKEQSLKRKRLGLVTEVHIISPRSEEDKMQAKENLRKYKENKERLKRLKEAPVEQSKKRVKVTVKNPRPAKKHKSTVKTKLKEAMDMNSESVKKIKESFRSNMAGVMVGILNPYRKPDCKEGKITNTEDFKHLARKLTHFVMLKELKHCQSIEDLTCTESVKSKAKEFVRKYMSKFGEIYTRPKDDLDY